MKIERTHNAVRNIIFGGALKLYQILLPFVMRTAMIYIMGMRYVGLNGLFASVLQVLNLAELGVGSAMVYGMYRPVAEDNTEMICALMRLYRLYYRIIGIVIAALGLCVMPFLDKIVKVDMVPEDVNIYALYLLNLGATVLSYWLFAYKNSILSAYQRADVASKVMLVMTSIQYLLQIAVLIIFKNYYYYVIVTLIVQAATNVCTAIAADRLYPLYKPKGKLPKEEIKRINTRVRDLFTSKIGSVTVNSADTIVISAFLGLTVLAVYQNYYYILTSVMGIVAVIFSACGAGIGNSIVMETPEKNFSDLRKFTFMIAWIAGICSCCFLNMYQPFMTLWVGEQNLMNFSTVVCLVIYFFVYEINQLLNLYKDSAGLWHTDKIRTFVTAMTNLAINLITVRWWGLYGVILSTVISTVAVGMPWLLRNLFMLLFGMKYIKPYLKNLIGYFAAAALSCACAYAICGLISIPAAAQIIVYALISVAVPNVIFIFLFRRTKEFKESIELIDNITAHRLRLAQRLNLK